MTTESVKQQSRITPGKRLAEFKTVNVKEEMGKNSKRSKQMTDRSAVSGKGERKSSGKREEALGVNIVNPSKPKTIKKSGISETYRKYALHQPLLTLNKEQKNKLSKLIERANSAEKTAKDQDEYLLRTKLNQLKKSKDKSKSKQQVYYCENTNQKPGVLLKKKIPGSKSTKLLGYTNLHQDSTTYAQTKSLHKSEKRFQLINLQNKKQMIKKQVVYPEGARPKKKVYSEEPTRGAYIDPIYPQMREPTSVSQPETLAERLIKHLKNPVPPQLESMSASKSHSYLHSVSRDQQAGKVKDDTPDKNQNFSTLATQKTRGTVQQNIIRKIQAKRSGHSVADAATSIQAMVRGWLARREYLKMRVINSSYRRSNDLAKPETDLFRYDEGNRIKEDNIFKRNCLQINDSKGHKGAPHTNTESLKPLKEAPGGVFSKVKHSRSVIDPDNGSKATAQRINDDVMEALSGEEFCGRTISSRNFSKNTSFKEESPKGNLPLTLKPSDQNAHIVIEESRTGRKIAIGDNTNFSAFAREEYRKWRTVSNIVHTLEKQLGEHAANEIQSMIKQLEIFAESSKKNLKEAFLANDSVASNTISETRSSKMNGMFGGNHCFERKVAIKGPKFINFQDKGNTENSINEESKQRENSEMAHDSPITSKKGLGSKRSSKEIIEKWVEPSEKHSVSSAYNGLQLSKSNIVLVSQLNINDNVHRDLYKGAPTSEKSSPRPNGLNTLFGHQNLISPSKLIGNGSHRSHLSDGLDTPDGNIDLAESFNQVIRRLKDQKMEQSEALEGSASKQEGLGELIGLNTENSLSDYGNENSGKEVDTETDERATDQLDHPITPLLAGEINEDSIPLKNEDKADHITLSLLELLIEEALLDANDIVINHQYNGMCRGDTSNRSMGFQSLFQEPMQPQLFSIQSIHDYLNKLIVFLLGNYQEEILEKLNQGLRLDRLSVIKLVREIEIDLFNNGGTSSLEYASDLVCAIQGKVLDEDWLDTLHPENRPTLYMLTPTSVDRGFDRSPGEQNELAKLFHRLVYESLNESLTYQWTKDDKIDYVRLLMLDKQPQAKQQFNEDSLESLMYYCRDTVLENSLFGCGMLPERTESASEYSRIIDPLLLRQIREERLIKMLGIEVTKSDLDSGE